MRPKRAGLALVESADMLRMVLLLVLSFGTATAYAQPAATASVAAELDRVTLPVSFIIGQRDLTAFRDNTAPLALHNRIQTIPQAAEKALRRFANADIIRLAGAGHASQVEDPPGFHAALLTVVR